MAKFFLQTFQNYKIFFLILLRKATLELKVAPTNLNSSAFLLHISKPFSNFELFSIFSQTFFETNFRHENKNNVVETISCFVYQLSKKYCLYYVCEHLKYCTQINEYCFKKHACLSIILSMDNYCYNYC